VIAEVREILVLSKQEAQKLDVETFNLRKLSMLELGNSLRLRSQMGLWLGKLKW
jgi:hypothetical protein